MNFFLTASSSPFNQINNINVCPSYSLLFALVCILENFVASSPIYLLTNISHTFLEAAQYQLHDKAHACYTVKLVSAPYHLAYIVRFVQRILISVPTHYLMRYCHGAISHFFVNWQTNRLVRERERERELIVSKIFFQKDTRKR